MNTTTNCTTYQINDTDLIKPTTNRVPTHGHQALIGYLPSGHQPWRDRFKAFSHFVWPRLPRMTSSSSIPACSFLVSNNFEIPERIVTLMLTGKKSQSFTSNSVRPPLLKLSQNLTPKAAVLFTTCHTYPLVKFFLNYVSKFKARLKRPLRPRLHEIRVQIFAEIQQIFGPCCIIFITDLDSGLLLRPQTMSFRA